MAMEVKASSNPRHTSTTPCVMCVMRMTQGVWHYCRLPAMQDVGVFALNVVRPRVLCCAVSDGAVVVLCCAVLQVRDPAKYSWDPKHLLSQICRVYLNLHRTDRQGVFAAAIAADERSYRPEMFAEVSNILRNFQLLGETEVRRGCWV
jgi:hypothetical protein